MSEYIVPQATALFGAAFLQYFAYGFLYMVEGCKLSEIKDEENQRNAESANEMRAVSGDSHISSSAPPRSAEENMQLEGGDDDEKVAKVEEVELDVPEEEKNQNEEPAEDKNYDSS